MDNGEDDQAAPQTARSASSFLSLDSTTEKSIKNAVVVRASRHSKVPQLPTRMYHAPGRSTPDMMSVRPSTRKSSAAELADGPWRQSGLFGGVGLEQRNRASSSGAHPTHRRDPSRQIMPNQAQFAERLEQQQEASISITPTGPVPLPPRPKAQNPKIETLPMEPQPLSPLSSTSAIYGSDIVRWNSKVDKMKRLTKPLGRNASRSSATPSASTSSSIAVSPSRLHRPVSLVSTVASHIKDILPAVREDDADSDQSSAPSRVPTFGEAMFKRDGYGSSSAAVMTQDHTPMPLSPTKQLLRPPSRPIRGPRLPPPVSAGQDSRSPLIRTPILASPMPESSLVSPPLLSSPLTLSSKQIPSRARGSDDSSSTMRAR
jgi:hypothetical protein